MKKLFVSVPMRGRTEEEIKRSFKRMHAIAENIFDEKLELIDTYFESDPSESVRNISLWFLGESIRKLSEADYFIGVEYPGDFYKGCESENYIATLYRIPSVFVDLYKIFPDAVNERIKGISEECPKLS